MKKAAAVLATIATGAGAMATGAGPAGAAPDQEYSPPAGSWNGNRIYLSTACHDGNDGVPGGPCIDNAFCGWSENDGSDEIAFEAAVGNGWFSLVPRGYKVRIGQGTVGENISRSNSYGAHVHVPVHSNGADPVNCGDADPGRFGTQVFWFSSAGADCASHLFATLKDESPGTNDFTDRRSFSELSSTNATACYLEAEFHTWNKGTEWLKDNHLWAYRIAEGIDSYKGFPRA